MTNQLPQYFRVFQPLIESQGGLITTWGLGSMLTMQPLISRLTGLWTIIVGYSKVTHNPGMLVNVSRQWTEEAASYGAAVDFKFLPNLHIKAWVLPGSMWIGSTNLVQNTISNCMVRVDYNQTLKGMMERIDKKASYLRPGVDLLKLPPLADGEVCNPIVSIELGYTWDGAPT